ncbi:P-type conjugative transfer protein TrbJ [Sphingobium sp. IP1]|uniref:P-type conjugative transfer protein TrbJ n=1 Tax=Sphingobium sp. IP1 TaxID=2021637 RepID=UPI000C076A2C|nr:P-type conjugative transfer protein TrbJ [Sphingobium sp. IP1]PHP19365.1 P-type conjugative transfer protein TrbJ [Sphingobium sp. IP1]
MKKRFVLIALMAPMAIMIPPAAHALVVYDPTNYASNVLQASRALQQINNQIQQIQNQATSLLNEARNLTSLPLSTLSTLQTQIGQTRRLLASAQRIAYDVQDVQNVFATRYSGAALRGDAAQMVANADARWHDSVDALQDAMRVQAGVVGNLDGAQSSMERLMVASQSATGALQVAQAGNQMLALQAQQLADLTAISAAQGRAQALAAAQQAAVEAESRERFRRFRGN